jgi:outer membrane lipopolysaccharide assembly protein LptE/RlpB
VPFVAGQTLSAIQYYDQAIEEKTGINSTSTGMNPDALQAQTATAVMAAMQGSANHIEIMARNLAEGGVAQMFKLMLALYIENCDSEDMMRLAGGDYEPVDPRSWDKRMGVSVKVGLGTGMHDQRQAALQQALQVQMQIFQSFGPENGLVGMTEVRHSLADILAMNGIKNAERYFKPMNPEIEQQIMMAEQQRAQSEGKQLTQPEAFVQAEQIKSESKAQTDMAKMQIDAQKAIAADDRERDQMDQDLLVDAAELLARYGAQVDVAQIKADQAKPRYPDSMPVDAVTGGRF